METEMEMETFRDARDVFPASPLSAELETSRDAREVFPPPPQPAQGSLSGPAAAVTPPPPQPAQGSLSGPAAAVTPPPPPPPPALLPDEPQRSRPCALGLALLQLGLASALVALSFAMVWFGSAEKMKNACFAWPGSWAMLCGILALTTCKRSEMILNRLLVLVSLLCVPVSFTGYILGCEGIEFVSRVPRCNSTDKENEICFCCGELNIAKCTEAETVLESCSSTGLVEKILLALCVLNAFMATICLAEVALLCRQILTSRSSCRGELQAEDRDLSRDPDASDPPVTPPSYVTAYDFGPLPVSLRTPGSGGLSLSDISTGQINIAERFLHMDPLSPYQDVGNLYASEQGRAQPRTVRNRVDSPEEGEGRDPQVEEISVSSRRSTVSLPNASSTASRLIRRVLSALQADTASIVPEEYGSWRALTPRHPS